MVINVVRFNRIGNNGFGVQFKTEQNQNWDILEQNLDSLNAPGSVTNVKIAGKSVSPEKTSFIETGTNLLNKGKLTTNSFVDWSDGSTRYSDKYLSSDLISIQAGFGYYFKNVLTVHYAFYDANGVHIKIGTNGGQTTGNVVTPPVNAYFMRVTVEDKFINVAQISKGSSDRPFEEFGFVFTGLKVNSDNIGNGSVSSEKIQNRSIAPEHFLDAEVSKNMFNKDTIEKGVFLAFDTGKIIANPAYSISDYIKVISFEKYARTYSHTMCFYDSNKKYMSGMDRINPPESPSMFTVPEGAVYVRFTINNSYLSQFQLEKGSVSTEYVPYGYKFKHLNVGGDSDKPFPLEIVAPRKAYILNGQENKVYYNNFILGLNPLVTLDTDTLRGQMQNDGWYIKGERLENFNVNFLPMDMHFNLLSSKKVNFEVLDPNASTGAVSMLAIGDSITRDGSYVGYVQNNLVNVKAVGTRKYDVDNFAREGRGGWKLDDYFNFYGKTTTVDSPFLFPIGIPGAKYWGNVDQWKKVCYTDGKGYDYEGFQKVAKGWTGSEFQFDVNGYPKVPSEGDVVLDPSNGKEAWFLQYVGGSWTPMVPQPTMEFNFSKYAERFAPVFEGRLPNVISILLGTNDFTFNKDAEELITKFVSQLEEMINSIKKWDVNTKVIINLTITGNDQTAWGKTNGSRVNAKIFNRNIQKLGLALIKKFDQDSMLSSGIIINPMNMFLDPAKINDQVHPNTEGHAEMGKSLAATLQKVR
ncbi:hypothetical protein ICW_05612 [Bacillus wiedmannii]|uniref:SGNH/GDSL hydrolase family protein n=1 Tax=Bacillus wiedmannii TaxID=1890302 RepID=UPI00027AB777|nr:SGNH/GDSL hydrolase family protein [Bacillus wiedmannii]EJS62949.1 hypothetical protein ICW_05612 [Bacillus wiedmannii]